MVAVDVVDRSDWSRSLVDADDRLKTVAEPSHTAERVLIVEDDPATRSGLTELVRTWGFTAEAAADGAEALEKVTAFRPSIVVTDLVMPRMSGIELLKALQPEIDNIKVILLTAQGTVDTAVEAVKAGAEDYLTKPLDPQQAAAAARAPRRDQPAEAREPGAAPAAQRARPLRPHHRQQPDDARALPGARAGGADAGVDADPRRVGHRQGAGRADHPPAEPARARRRLSRINCAAIPDTLLESEIFGHEKGAFTGATDRRAGCFELADRGTLFLDEIAEMTPATQVKLLRVLQERKFRRLGGRIEQEVDVRVLAATNIDPVAAIRDGKLREDLYYRLNVFTIALPPLRERKDDLPLLIQAFIDEFNTRDRRTVKGVSPEAMRLLEHYDWPGNVRELRNVIERATILARGDSIEPAHLPVFGAAPRAPRAGAGQRRDDRAGHDGGRSGAEADPRDARGRRRQQDPRRRNARHQPEDAPQQAESVQGTRRVPVTRPAVRCAFSLKQKQVLGVTLDGGADRRRAEPAAPDQHRRRAARSESRDRVPSCSRSAVYPGGQRDRDRARDRLPRRCAPARRAVGARIGALFRRTSIDASIVDPDRHRDRVERSGAGRQDRAAAAAAERR